MRNIWAPKFGRFSKPTKTEFIVVVDVLKPKKAVKANDNDNINIAGEKLQTKLIDA